MALRPLRRIQLYAPMLIYSGIISFRANTEIEKKRIIYRIYEIELPNLPLYIPEINQIIHK